MSRLFPNPSIAVDGVRQDGEGGGRLPNHQKSTKVENGDDDPSDPLSSTLGLEVEVFACSAANSDASACRKAPTPYNSGGLVGSCRPAPPCGERFKAPRVAADFSADRAVGGRSREDGARVPVVACRDIAAF